MAVGLKLDSVIDEIGAQDFFHSFFSTIHHHLENGDWGSDYPVMMTQLYQGKLSPENASAALNELNTISNKLSKIPPEKVVWDIDDLSAMPPWGANISSEITDLSNYFVTSTGRDLIETIKEALESMVAHGGTLEIVTV